MKYQVTFTLLALSVAMYLAFAQQEVPFPKPTPLIPAGAIAVWDFEGPTPLFDKINSIQGTLVGGATIVNGTLSLNGLSQYFFANSSLVNLADKTLESWVNVKSLTSCCPGVGGIQTPDGGIFDSIVYNEKGGQRWIAGSDFGRRSMDPTGTVETEANSRFVHIAITYTNKRVQIYREGVKVEDYLMVNSPQVFSGRMWFISGMRHLTGGSNFLNGAVDEIRFYNRPLSADEILGNWCSKASIRSTKTLSYEMNQYTTASPFTLTTVTGTGSVTMFATSSNPNVASVSVSPAAGVVGTVRGLTYSANEIGSTTIQVYHSDSVRTCVAQEFVINVYPALFSANTTVCNNIGGKVLNGRCIATNYAPNITWPQANDACKNRGGNLVTVRDSFENTFLRSQITGGAFWIGLHDRYTTGLYSWTDGSNYSYRNWAVNEPTEAKGEECVAVQSSGTWTEERCASTYADYYICQF